jgi:hypothetical protein
MQAALAAVEKDPALIELSRKIDATLGLEQGSGKPASAEELRRLNSEVERVLGPAAPVRTAASASLSDIAAYRLELQRTAPRAGQFMQRLYEQQRAYAQQHAQADREALARVPGGGAPVPARELVQRHHALAAQQLADAAVLWAQLREALAPRVARMAQLLRAAEQRNGAPGERNEGYALLKAYLELLLTVQRETVQDTGFWAGTRVASRSLYEHSLAPGFDLRANGELPTAGPHYPGGRAIVVGLPPGIH